MGRVVYQTCIVLRSTPWTEDQSILSLLSKERCVFSALWKRPKRRREAEDQQPNLFDTITGALAFDPGGHHKLRQFEATSLAPRKDIPTFEKLNLMARIFQWLLGENEGDPQPYSLWKKHESRLSNPLEWTDFFADLLFVLGCLPETLRCQQCTGNSKLGLSPEGEIVCSECQEVFMEVSTDTQKWVSSRHLGQRWLDPVPPDAKLVMPFLRSFLPERMWQDPIITKLLPSVNRP